MHTVEDRTDRFELIAVSDGDRLGTLADSVLSAGCELSIRQEPTAQLVMQRAVEPVEGQPFNLGEVVVTVAEVLVDGAKGFAMVPGKDERRALSGAIVDAAVAADHECRSEIESQLREAADEQAAERREQWAHTRETAVEFDAMEEDT
ncbi:phosphonate C-P lyase system protein PhnG [Halapricum salinum]|uniref:Phosphonate C-P lyase system protein PhnG n=1 Tax=Halapricum salinum TaxID=1457250 RepID=A0A4D6HD08_9EURY|nr:phosphonate C-P lyase system protein PhnG [Halapricum salinum]QCC50942.1 phosphonate C-P lyase system protein PhnG [Halapricum salinum]